MLTKRSQEQKMASEVVEVEESPGKKTAAKGAFVMVDEEVVVWVVDGNVVDVEVVAWVVDVDGEEYAEVVVVEADVEVVAVNIDVRVADARVKVMPSLVEG